MPFCKSRSVQVPVISIRILSISYKLCGFITFVVIIFLTLSAAVRPGEVFLNCWFDLLNVQILYNIIPISLWPLSTWLCSSALWLVQPNCWWDSERQDCQPCRCSHYGAISQRCDAEGRCICRPGFVGRRCDLRRPNHGRRETRRPVERVPVEAVQQRWSGPPRTGGCPRGAYMPRTGVTAARGLQHGVVLVTCGGRYRDSSLTGGASMINVV